MTALPQDQPEAGQGRSHLVDAAVAFGLRVASAVLVFLVQVFLARAMSMDDYGSYITAWTWLVMLGAFMPLGFSESAVRFVPRYRARGRHGSAAAFWRFGLRVVLLMSLLVAGFAVIAATAGGLLDSRVGLIMLIVAAGLPFLAIDNFLEGMARAHGWYRLTSVPIYVIRPLLIMAGCASLALAGIALDLAAVGSVVIGSVALVSVILMVMVVSALRAAPRPASQDQVTGSRRIWLKASLPLMLVSGVEDLLIYSDVLVLGAMLDPDQVSIYFAAARALSLANFVYFAFFFVSARGFSISNALADRAKLQEAVWATMRATFWFTVLAVAATLLAGPWLLAAFGESFSAGYTVMWILGAGLIARGLSGQSVELLVTTGRQREIILAGLTSITFNVGLSVLLIPHYGIEGAAFGTAAAMVIRSFMLCRAVHRSLDLSVVSLGLPSLRFSAAG